MAEVIKPWEGFHLAAPPLNGARAVKGLKRGRAVSAGELLARHPHPCKGDVHAPNAGIITEISEIEIIIQRDDRVVGEPPQPRPVRDLAGPELAAAFKELGLDRPKTRPLEPIIINTLNPEPGLNYSAALFSEHLETMLAGVQAAQRLWPGRPVIWAAAAPIPSLSDQQFHLTDGAFPAAVPSVLKKKITGLSDPYAAGVLGGRELYFLGRVWRTGLPITRMVLGLGASSYFVPVGGRAADLLTFANLYPHGRDVVVKGGLVRGTALARLGRGLGKSAQALNLVRGDRLPTPGPPAPCLGCGACAKACPAGLDVQAASSLKPDDWRRGRHQRALEGCLACGACATLCPAHRPLLAMVRLALPMAEGDGP